MSHVQPVFQAATAAQFTLGGELGRRLAAVTDQWLLPAPFANPAMLEMFRNRDRQPYQNQVPWAGEFAGKYLTHAVQILRLTRDARLRQHLDWFVGELVALQDADGYLGPWPKAWRLRKGPPTCDYPWDAWGHYHAMLGLMLWHDDTGDARALACCRRMADYLCTRFLNNPAEKLHDTGAHEMNQAPVHSLAMLFTRTGEPRYRDLALQIVREFELPPAGDYLRTALAGKEFSETPKPRWESLHPILGLAELYYVTGDAQFRQAFEHLWWSMVRGDRHNNGGFTSGEQATGNPYHDGPIETCCTIAWLAMSVEMLRLTGNPVVADEIELALLNSGLGLMSASGRWVTYNTPMNGRREASAHTIVFQARAGSPELNCCSVNGPRALGLIAEWGLMRDAAGLVLNYYGPGTFEATLADGCRVRLEQTTDYPREGMIAIAVTPAAPAEFTLALRIPHWSRTTRVMLNGAAVGGARPGEYLRLARRWQAGDRVTLELDFSPHFWVHPQPYRKPGEKPESAESAGAVAVADRPARTAVLAASIYRGPLLLAYDPRFNAMDPDALPALAGDALELVPVAAETWLKPWLLLTAKAGDGSDVRLCDFASAGAAGNEYISWLPVKFARVPAAEFSPRNPLRSARV